VAVELNDAQDRELRRIVRAGAGGINARLLDQRSVQALMRRQLVTFDEARGTYVATVDGKSRTFTSTGDWAGVKALTMPEKPVIPETSVLHVPEPMLPIDDDRARWLTWHRGGIGSSDIPPLVGFGYGSPWEVWADKMGMLPERESNEQMDIGKALEPFLIERFLHKMADFDFHIVKEQAELEQPGYPHRRCTADALVAEGELDDAFAVLECKSNVSPFAGTDWTAEMPEHVLAQVTWQMGVAGLEQAFVVVMHFGRTVEVIPVALDIDLLKLLRKIADDFWHSHVLTGIAPPTDASEATSIALRDAYPESNEDAVLIGAHDLAELREAKAGVKVAELRKTLVENRIKSQLGEAGIAVDENGEVAATWKSGQTKGLDTKALEHDHPDLVAQYRVRPPQRRFLTKGDPDAE
jgi:putative phage-type endonuclease